MELEIYRSKTLLLHHCGKYVMLLAIKTRFRVRDIHENEAVYSQGDVLYRKRVLMLQYSAPVIAL